MLNNAAMIIAATMLAMSSTSATGVTLAEASASLVGKSQCIAFT